jgi:hypothetical protein
MRDDKGKFIKGSGGGNPSGRPKSFKIDAAARAEFGDDPFAAVKWLMRNSETKDELFRYIKELLPYYKPKLSSIKQEVNEVREIRLSWGGVNQVPFGSLDVTEPRTIEVQDEAQRLSLTKEELTGIMTELSAKPKRGRPKKGS